MEDKSKNIEQAGELMHRAGEKLKTGLHVGQHKLDELVGKVKERLHSDRS